MALTDRGKALRFMSSHRGITEQPHGSNTDNRKDGIRKAQEQLGKWLVGLPWCGVWCAAAMRAAGVRGVNYRQASVAFIEDDARAQRAPFWDWQPASAYKKVLRGDLVVLFGRGVHVGMVRGFKRINGQVHVITDEGNTSSGVSGSQSNGGGAFRRVRPLKSVHGFARVDYPGGAVKRAALRLMMVAESRSAVVEPVTSAQVLGMPISDRILREGARARSGDPEAQLFAAEMDRREL